MISIFERKESLLQEADRLEKEQFKKQTALLQDYYQEDEGRNKVKEAFSLDERAVEVGWKPELFFALLEEDVGEILRPLRKQFPRLCAYEEELVRYHCAGN